MATDNWQQFKDVFQTALDLPVEERSAYLDRVCADASFRKEVESLLDCYTGKEDEPGDRSGVASVSDLIDETSVKKANTDRTSQAESLVETFIDHYQIACKISGSGPRGLYRAIRIDAPDQNVAIRLLKAGADNGVYLRWFNQDRLILLKLRHANVVSLLDTGLDRGGEPYLVSEYVDGTPIAEYCDSKKLNTRSRIELFLQVCGAIQYAHQRLIAHGSLDLTSVLVNNNGATKVLNLGIANLLHREFSPQATGSAKPEVLEYLSPERIRGEPITTHDDVYSLGIVFYQLLTGHSPYRIKGDSVDEILPDLFEAVRPSKAIRQISEDVRPDGSKITINPHHLSRCRNERAARIRRRLAGDLDNIVLKAIQRDAAKRYSTVEQFCGDVQRYLERRPVSVTKNTLAYRARKFTARHKAGAIAAVIGVTALIASLVPMVESFLLR
jgi:eukaryotic-like serine/threonine-protein kinase